MHRQNNTTISALEILLEYQIPNVWLKNLLMLSNKKNHMFPLKSEKIQFLWNRPGPLLIFIVKSEVFSRVWTLQNTEKYSLENKRHTFEEYQV